MMYGITVLIFEYLLDKLFPSQGFILLDRQGELFQITPHAKRLCQRLSDDSTAGKSADNLILLPAAVQESKSLLMDGLKKMGKQDFRFEVDVLFEDQTQIQVQANWVDLGFGDSPFMFLTLIDLTEVVSQKARFDACRFGLTQKEGEILMLRHRGLSYRQICKKLYVTINTVKKHVKNINLKKRSFLC